MWAPEGQREEVAALSCAELRSLRAIPYFYVSPELSPFYY